MPQRSPADSREGDDRAPLQSDRSSFTNSRPTAPPSAKSLCQARPDGYAASAGQGPKYPNIKDLQQQAQAALRSLDPQLSIRKLLQLAESSAKRAQTDLTFKRPDKAYVAFLVCSELVVNLIPRAKEFPALDTDRADWQRVYLSLQRYINDQNPSFRQIYAAIVADNERRDILSDHGPFPATSSSATSPTPNDSPLGKSRSSINAEIVPARDRSHKLHLSKSLKVNAEHACEVDSLAARFSKLRSQSLNDPPNATATAQNSTPQESSDDKLNSPSNSPRNHGRPLGPRQMPERCHASTKSSLIADSPGSSPQGHLPEPPRPAYDPAKRKNGVTAAYNRPYVNGLTSTVPETKVDKGHQRRLDQDEGDQLSKGRSSNAISLAHLSAGNGSHRTSIEATELHELCQTANVLLLDLRARTAFEAGHIFSRKIVCIEPVGIVKGMTVADLKNRLILSPEIEQNAFELLCDYDYVVYHDQDTIKDDFLQCPSESIDSNALRILHDALCEHNHTKPLRRSPLFLRGGLDAWIDVVGPRALASSDIKPKPVDDPDSIRKARPLGRMPKVNPNSSLEIRKRRLREQNALEPEEQQRWLENARREEIPSASYKIEDLGQVSAEGLSDFRLQTANDSDAYEQAQIRYPELEHVEDNAQDSPKTPSGNLITSSVSNERPTSIIRHPPSIASIPTRPPATVSRKSYGGISSPDEAPGSRSSSRQASAFQQPLYQPRMSYHLKLPRIGLVNFGVTCYMNATIQCLLATIPLSRLFLEDGWKKNVQKNWKGSNGILPGIFANLFRSLWQSDAHAIRPTSLRAFCGRLNDEWAANRQQDAKEFFDFLIDCLHEDLNVNFNRNALRPLTDEQESVRERLPISQASWNEWQRYSHREKSSIADLFAGQHASRLRCRRCSFTSTTYEAFYSISVEIPRQDRKQGWTIDDCLLSYCREEMLAGNELWKCPRCKSDQEATKQIIITRPPLFLVMHFKRFEMRRGDAQKVHTPISFNLRDFDLQPYTAWASSKSKSPNGQDNPSICPPFIYDAYAVMRHIGSSGNSGHYIAMVKDSVRGTWRKFDDDKVCDFDPARLKASERLQNEEAYLVFFARR